MKIKNYNICYLLFLMLLFGCKAPDNPKEKFIEKHQKAVVIDRVVCTNSIQQSYCLYLPSNYKPDKNSPIIYAFDAQGDGKLPVVLMKDQAEKLGYILVGSNNLRNGLRSEEINRIVNILLEDTKQKLAIDPKRIYTAGFSGGARVACNAAQSLKGINGVIACSAGFQPGNKAPDFHFIGVAGLQDMNYLEMKKLEEHLKNLKASAQLLVFEGTHHWPPKPVIDEAMILLEIYAMRDSLIPIDRKIADTIIKDNMNQIGLLMSRNNPDSLVNAYSLLNRTIEMLDGLTNISKPKAALENLMKYPEIRNYLIEQATLEDYEEQKQHEFSAAFQSKKGQWWQKELKSIAADTLIVHEKLRKDVALRLLGYVSLNCYSYVNMALQTQNWETLELYTEIYHLADPKNYYCYYAMACLKANTGKAARAVEDLKKAIAFGYKNTKQLGNDPLLKSLNGSSEFEALARK
jgi:dienelactone hydrolase